MRNYDNFINGKFAPSTGRERITCINPSTGAAICTVPDSTAQDVEAAIAAASAAQKAWARRPAVERALALRAIATKIRENVEPLARLITEEQGKTLGLARVEVAFTADYMDYMAEWARRIEGEILESDRPGETILLFRQAIGVIGGILPWNFPVFLIARKAAPELVTGNTIVIKPSEETPHNAVKFCELMAQTDLPPGVINIVHGRGAGAGKALCTSPKIGMISFTGSVETGSAIMAAAAPNITKLNLELGGKAPAIVMADADLAMAVKAVTASRVINSGQVCNCAERIYVQGEIADEFTEKLAAAMQATRCGNPLADEAAEYGPLINQAGYNKVEALVRGAVAEGATLVTGGHRHALEGGYYYQPTVLAGLPAGHGNCAQGDLRAGDSGGEVRRSGRGHRVRQRFRLRADVEHLHARLEHRIARLPGDPFRRDLHQSREFRGDAGFPRGRAEERHRRRGRQARVVRVHADARGLYAAGVIAPRIAIAITLRARCRGRGGRWRAGGPGRRPALARRCASRGGPSYSR